MSMKYGRRGRNRWSSLAVLAVAAAAAQPLGAQAPAVAAFFTAPFTSEISAAPAGGHVAWVVYERGVRNIHVASPPQYEALRLTSYTHDDGQEIGGLTWTTDGRTLLFVRGSGANRQGENPNPTSDPAGVEQAIWRVTLDGGEPVRIGVGSNVTISPRGDGFAFTRGGQIWWAPLTGDAQPTQLVRARGGSGSLRFSPDGAQLAFISGRGTHSFLGVYDMAERTLRWVAPSVDRDRDPAWSPDGRSIAWIRIPTSSRLTLFRAVREARPWSIMAADVATLTARHVWRADEGRGSAFWGVVADNQLIWTADDRIVFPWEKTGWIGLWSIPATGGTAIHLTPGEFEVEYVRLGANGRDILYNSNQGDIDRRHLWQVPARGGAAPRALTSGDGIEWAAADLPGSDRIAFIRSTAARPAQPMLLEGGRMRELAPNTVPASFPERAHVVPQAVMIEAADGMRIPAQLFVPRDVRAGERRPAAIFFHGGSRRQMLLGYHYGIYYNNTYAFNQWLANAGYVVLSVNFRSGTGYGMEFREALNYGAGGASEFNDVLGAGLYMRNRPDVDPSRIGIWGGSYGGYLTAMGLSRASDLFAAGVDIHGVHDWNVGIRTFVPSYNPLEVPSDSELAFRSSPMATIDTWRSPVLVIHGDDDRNVSFIETVTLVEALRERDVHVEQLVFPDEVHSFLLHANVLATYEAAADFFERMLRGRVAGGVR
jgi:dipeptidyl aminopeptidase/acylaminoacyl peptidase